MKKFLNAVLSEEGQPSSKRVAFFILLLAFLFEVFIDVFAGKLPIQPLMDELFYAFQAALLTVFGSNILNAWKDVKTTQSNNNAQVGASSPTQPPPTPPTPPSVTNVIQ